MRRSHRWVVLANMLVAPALLALPRGVANIELQPESKVWVDGMSSVRGWSCHAEEIDAAITSASVAATRAILQGEKVIKDVHLTISAGGLECGNGTMNGHMRKALKVQAQPEIKFHLTGYELLPSGSALQVRITGDLTLAGTTKTITLNAVGEDAGEQSLRVKGTYELQMSDFGVKAPTLMLGTLRVHDKVKVGFDLVLADCLTVKQSEIQP